MLLIPEATARVDFRLKVQLILHGRVETVRQDIVDLQNPIHAIETHAIAHARQWRIRCCVIGASRRWNNRPPWGAARPAYGHRDLPLVGVALKFGVRRKIANEITNRYPVTPLVANPHLVRATHRDRVPRAIRSNGIDVDGRRGNGPR